MRILRSVLVFLLLLSCRSPAPDGDELFLPAKNLGKISDKLKEASGLIASINNPGRLWSVNDSGNSADVFLIDDKAKIEMTCTLEGILNRDWEEISRGPGPEPGKNYLYVADIGDNNAKYDLKFIYRFEEPVFTGDEKMAITNFETITLKLPDDRRDTETLIIDPITSDLYMISKREETVTVYRAKFPFGKETIVMENLGKIDYKLIVAGSISVDGKELLLKNYNKIYYWKRSAEESLMDLLRKEPVKLAYDPEHQGEAIAWAADNSGFYTLSESSVMDRAQLRFYKRKKQKE